jgi:hypothetical protein
MVAMKVSVVIDNPSQTMPGSNIRAMLRSQNLTRLNSCQHISRRRMS